MQDFVILFCANFCGELSTAASAETIASAELSNLPKAQPKARPEKCSVYNLGSDPPSLVTAAVITVPL